MQVVKQTSAGIFKQPMEARKLVGIELSYQPARLHNLAELVLGIYSWAPYKFKIRALVQQYSTHYSLSMECTKERGEDSTKPEIPEPGVNKFRKYRVNPTFSHKAALQ